MATPTPKEVLSDRKIAIILDDLLQECLDATGTAKKLSRSKVMKALTKATATRFDRAWDLVLRAASDTENERDRCLNGKSKDLKRMRKSLQTQVDALDTLEAFNGRLQALEDQAADSALSTFLSLVVITQGVSGEMAILQRRIEALRKKLAKAITATRDAKTKAMVATALAAIGICLVPFGPVVVLVSGLTIVAVDVALDQALNGNQDSDLRQNWDYVSRIGGITESMAKTPRNFGPVLALVGGAADFATCFSNVREKQAIEKEIKALSAEINKKMPAFAKQFKALGKAGEKSRKDLKRAISSVNSLRPGKGPAHKLLRMI